MVDLGNLDAIAKRPECDLCSLITLGCKQTWLGTWEEGSSGAGTKCFINALVPDRQQAKGYAMQIAVTGKNWQWVELEVIFKGHSSGYQPVQKKSFEVCPKVDLEFLKSSIKCCETTHDGCAHGIQSTPDKMCVIDLKNMNIGPAPEMCRYFALSYVWGQIMAEWLTLTRNNVESLSQENALVDAHLPQTVRDAMQLCLDLGERFLWVDSLCIVQDDPVFQKQQIDIMDAIYAYATLTIVAGAGNHANSGLPGISDWSRTAQRQTITIQDIEISNVLPRLKHTAEVSVWNTRGWTFQERMFSRRCIFLTEVQAFYACSQGVYYERKDGLLSTGWGVERLKATSTSRTLKEFYSQAATQYTLRSLTAQADIFRAFQGVMNDMSRTYDQVFYFGLPNKNFEDALLWQQAGPAEKRSANIVLPSWSWACTKGAIKYSFTEKIVTASSSLPAVWRNGEEPDLFRIDWLLNVDGSKLLRITETPPFPTSPMFTYDRLPADLVTTTLQGLGRLLFRTQHAFMSLTNSVPFRTIDSWWTDYTQDIDQSNISITSILQSGSPGEPAGFIELDKSWAEENLIQEAEARSWEFLAISLAMTDLNDYMHRHFTMRRNVNYPLVLSRNVRELVVNVMLVEREGGVARRLGVGKIYLDCWEEAEPQRTWMVLG